jgi:endo-1,4-beta-xylanase
MLHLIGGNRSGSLKIRPLVTLWTLPFTIAFFALQLNAQTVATYSFEDATADGWISFFGATTPVATNAAAYAGSYSLLTSTSSTGTGGPSIDLSTVLAPGAKYTITG